MVALHQNVTNCHNTLIVLTQLDDLSSRYMNGLNVFDRCGHATRQPHPDYEVRDVTGGYT